VRIWLTPRVKPGHRYRIDGGEIEVESIEQIELADITPELARESGFVSVIDLLKIAKHGQGSNVLLVVTNRVGALQRMIEHRDQVVVLIALSRLTLDGFRLGALCILVLVIAGFAGLRSGHKECFGLAPEQSPCPC
jgi:hypothetical protein